MRTLIKTTISRPENSSGDPVSVVLGGITLVTMLQYIGKYKILDNVGFGGQGTVYRAHDTSLDRVVGIKVMNQTVSDDPGYLDALTTEAQLVASLDHPNIVTVYELDVEGDRPYIVMEYVPDSLDRQIKSGRIPPNRAVEIAEQVCSGLASAHDQRVVHRDIKPANILLTTAGEAKITDFGIARAVASSTHAPHTSFAGTYPYMPPEQWEETPAVDRRSDIYAMGVTLFEMVVGEVPFPGSSVIEMHRQHQQEPVPPLPLNLGVPSGLWAVIQKAMAKQPASRFQTANEMADALHGLFSASGSDRSLYSESRPNPPEVPPRSPSPQRASIRRESSSDTDRSLAVQYKADRKFAEAIRLFTNCLKADKKNASLLGGRGECYLYLGRNKDALKDYDRAIKTDPLFIGAYAGKCLSLCATGRLPDALKILESIPSNLKDTEDYILASAAYYTHVGETEQAIGYCNRILRDDSQSIPALVRKVEALLSVEDLLGALDCCNLIESLDPSEPKAYYYRAYIRLFYQGEKDGMSYFDPENSLQDISRLIEYDPEWYVGYALRGYANLLWYETPATPGDVIQDTNRAIYMIDKPVPSDFWIFSTRGAAWQAMGQTGSAIEDFTISANLCPSRTRHQQGVEAELWKKIAECYGILGDAKRAITNYTKALTINNKDVVALKKRADAYFDIDKYNKAFEDNQAIISLVPEEYMGYRDAANNLWRMKHYDAADRYIDQAIMLDSDDQLVFWIKGKILDKLGRWPEAALNIDRAHRMGGPMRQAEREIKRKAEEFNSAPALVQSWRKFKNKFDQ